MDTFSYSQLTPHGLTPGKEVTSSTRLILDTAEKLGIKWRNIPGTIIFELEYHGKVKHFRYQIPSETSDIGFYSCDDKSVTNNLLRSAGITVPRGFHLTREDSIKYWHEVFDALKKPLVVKPTHGHKGQRVAMNIQTADKYEDAVHNAFLFSNLPELGVIVEEMFQGTEYRILASREKIIAVLNRIPANITGDGVSTIQQLIDRKNADPRRSDNPNDALVKIKVDDVVLSYLEDQHLSLTSVVENDQRIFLRGNSNISTGGDSIDMTDRIHPSVAKIAVQAMNAIPGLAWAGIDFMSTDITVPQTAGRYCVIEMNSSPGLDIHREPFEGKSRNVEFEFLCVMFPELEKKEAKTA